MKKIAYYMLCDAQQGTTRAYIVPKNYYEETVSPNCSGYQLTTVCNLQKYETKKQLKQTIEALKKIFGKVGTECFELGTALKEVGVEEKIGSLFEYEGDLADIVSNMRKKGWKLIENSTDYVSVMKSA